MKKINISEEKFKKALREIFKEKVLNGPNPDNYNPLGLENDMGVGDDGTMEHNVGTEFEGETRDANLYPGFEEEYEDPFNQDGWENHTPSDNDLYDGRW